MCPSMDLNHPHNHHNIQTLTLSIPHRQTTTTKPPPPPTTTTTTTATAFSIRLFYVRISPCATTSIPTHLTLRHLPTTTLSINSTTISTSSTTTTTTLRRDRLDSTSSEVTYVSTDTLSISHTLNFEVYDDTTVILCGSIERFGPDWCMDCHPGSIAGSGSSFFQPKMRISSPSMEVYVAGRWNDLPVILTKVVNISPRRKLVKYGTLDVIPEGGDEIDKEINMNSNDLAIVPNGFIRHRKFQFPGNEDEYVEDGKMEHSYYPEDVYVDEDGQLSWFNAGVRVGVGIGLGMCLGIGIGVGLLMRSYQTTTRNIRRRFL